MMVPETSNGAADRSGVSEIGINQTTEVNKNESEERIFSVAGGGR